MFFNRKSHNQNEYKITESDLKELKESFKAIEDENERLKKRCNYEHLIQELDFYKKTNNKQSLEIERLIKKNEQLKNTINNERCTLKAVLKTLDESTKFCENALQRYDLDKKTKYISILDIKG